MCRPRACSGRPTASRNILTEIAAVLAFSASENNDKVGCIFFSDRVEKFIPPKKGRSHILMIIRELIGFQPQLRGTAMSEALRFLTNVMKKHCTAFLLSDFLDPASDGKEFDNALKIAGKYYLVGIRAAIRAKPNCPTWDRRIEGRQTGRKVWVTFVGGRAGALRPRMAGAERGHRLGCSNTTASTRRRYRPTKTTWWNSSNYSNSDEDDPK